MIGVLRVAPRVEFTTIAPGGFMLLSALTRVALTLGIDLWITSACDGEHSGPNDPHKRGEAFDVRTHGLADKVGVLGAVMMILGWVGFYGFLEDEGTPNEHLHFQVAKGTVYP